MSGCDRACAFAPGRSWRWRCWACSALIVVSMLAAQQQGRHGLRAARQPEHRNTATSRRACGACDPTCTSPASWFATTCSTRPRRLPSTDRGCSRSGPKGDQMLDELEPLVRASDPTGSLRLLRRELERLLALLRAAVRRNDRRRSLRLPAPRGRAAPRCGHGDLGGDRGASTTRTCTRSSRPQPRGSASSISTSRARWPPSLALGVVVAVVAVIRIRVLERRSEEQHSRTRAGRTGAAPAVEPARPDPGGRAEEPRHASCTTSWGRCSRRSAWRWDAANARRRSAAPSLRRRWPRASR